MQKIRTLVKGPLLTQSGYGVHSRQIFQSLINDPMFDVYVEPINWGICPFLTESTELRLKILQCADKYVLATKNKQTNWDLFLHITIPNEFQRLGKYNIGITAGVETDRVSHTWIQKCEEMDLIIVPSDHSLKSFTNTTVEWHNQETGQKGNLKITKPVVVCHEGVDTEIFKKLTNEEYHEYTTRNFDFESDFNFLHIGQWGHGGFGEDRKNIGNLIKFFIEEFKGRKDVGLVLKINIGRNSVADYKSCLNRIQQIKSNFKLEEVPPIYLIHASLTDKEMSALYNHPKIKAFVSLSAGEGFALPLLEAAACELPIIATNWSGHLDFLNKGKFSAVEYDLKEIPKSVVWKDILIEGSRWAVVKEQDAKHRMKKMTSAYSLPVQWAKDLATKIKEEFDVNVVYKDFVNVLKLATQESLAPQLNPIDYLKSFIDTPDGYNVLYTMPISAGDVLMSTAVLDGLIKELPENHKIYFATDPRYWNILDGNPHVHKVIPWNQSMINIEIMEEVFDLVLTPNIATQFTFSNWVRKGQGRLIVEEFANHCQCKLGDYYIKTDDSIFNKVKNLKTQDDTVPYVTVHVGSGKDQWEARKYVDWQEIVSNLKDYIPNLKIVQVGSRDEGKLENADIDLRGETSVHQLASVLKSGLLHLGIDSLPMHICAALNVPVVALFGSSYAKSTGPWFKNIESSKFILLEPENRMGCEKACYKHSCRVNKENPCINMIDPLSVFKACVTLLRQP